MGSKLIVLMLCALMILPAVSALDFDNVRTYNPETKEVLIKNAFGLPIIGDDIARVKLNTDLNQKVGVGYVKVFEFTINSYSDYSEAIKKMEYFNIKRGSLEATDIKLDLKYKEIITENISVEKCDLIVMKDGESLDCHYEIEEIERVVWKDYLTKNMAKGEITIAGFTTTKEGDKVEFIPTWFGERLTEFASWEAGLNTDLISYWTLNESSGNAVDSLGNYDLTNTGTLTYTASLIGNGAVSDSGGKYLTAGSHITELDGTGDFTAQAWIKKASLSDGGILGQSGNAGGLQGVSMRLRADGSMWIQFNVNEGAKISVACNPATNDWIQFVLKRDSGNLTLFRNGLALASTPDTTNFNDATNFQVGGDGWNLLTSGIDEVAIWDRALTDTEITTLYNGGTGITYTNVFNDVIAELNTPIDYFNTTDATIDLSCNFSGVGETNISNVTILVYDSSTNLDYSNTDLTPGGLVNSYNKTWTTTTLTDGSYNWSCSAIGDGGETDNTINRTLTIDTTEPEISITYPINGSTIISTVNPTNVSLNATISDAGIGLSSCWYFNGTANSSLTCGDNATINLGYGDHTLYVYANDTLGNENSAVVSFNINYLQESADYPNPAIEGETYPINITLNATELNSFNGTLYYNGTTYNTTSTIIGSIGTLNTNILMDSLTANSLKTFYWNYTLNGINYTSATYNHTVYFIPPINVSASCSAGLSSAMYFDFKDELNLTALTANLDYNFKFGVTNGSYKEIYGTLSSVSSFNLCINSTVNNNYIMGEGEIQYSLTGYADRRFYTFSTQRLSNVTVNNTLYLLPTASATSFLFDFKDTNLAPYTDKYTTLLRWYPELNQYKVVEMAKTDDKGETIMRVQVEDTDYRVGLYYKNGSLIDLLNPVRFACLSAPCSYSTLVDTIDKDYTSFFDVEGGISFNETTNIWTLAWNDPTQNTQTMRFLVTRERGDSSFTICETSGDGFTGVLTCDSTGYTGTLLGVAYRTASPETPIFSKFVNTIISPFAGDVGLFLSFILVALLMLIGVYSPVVSVILGVIAFIPALYLGVITLAIFIGIAVIGGIVVHFMKRTG